MPFLQHDSPRPRSRSQKVAVGRDSAPTVLRTSPQSTPKAVAETPCNIPSVQSQFRPRGGRKKRRGCECKKKLSEDLKLVGKEANASFLAGCVPLTSTPSSQHLTSNPTTNSTNKDLIRFNDTNHRVRTKRSPSKTALLGTSVICIVGFAAAKKRPSLGTASEILL
ncbi:hypothetical protein Pla52n_48050 [Stieleria varia]|uniref:Uncharacterized protein n=1 Tax=Stieleria varia TaxID=2528005 RepID=A0A5C6AE88_9BACT|nr:hypothetical protein Pla52n_48050 [Stieleria varia]